MTDTEDPGTEDPGTEDPGTEDAVVIWITEGTWQASVDAALRLAPPAAPITLLHVIPAELPEAAHGAYLGLFGRGRPDRDPGPRVAKFAEASAAELLDAAAGRLGRPCRRAERRGVPEREVVTAAADAALLIVARDGDRSRLGPKSLGKATRFVVDHAPCPVLVVWPGAAPAVATIPPPPRGPHPAEPPHPPGHHPPGPRPPGPPRLRAAGTRRGPARGAGPLIGAVKRRRLPRDPLP